MNVLNTFEDKRNAKETVTGHHYVRKNGRVISVKEDKYDLYQKNKRVRNSIRLEIKARDIDEYLRRRVAIQLLVNECRKDEK